MVKGKRGINKKTSKVTSKVYQVPPISGAAYEYVKLLLNMVYDHVRYELDKSYDYVKGELEKALINAAASLKDMRDAEKEPDEVELQFGSKGNVKGVLLSKDKVATTPEEIDYWSDTMAGVWRKVSDVV